MVNRFCTISFPETSFVPIQLQAHQQLAEFLTIQNSPVLFGCRTGICGTCLVRVVGEVPAANLDEQELIETIVPETLNARLACQISLTNDIEIFGINL